MNTSDDLQREIRREVAALKRSGRSFQYRGHRIEIRHRSGAWHAWVAGREVAETLTIGGAIDRAKRFIREEREEPQR
jgi:hypothetical protein